MNPLLRAALALSRGIDRLNTWVGKATIWLVLASVLISTGNALSRKLLDQSSNAMLEIQWYLFAAVFLLAGGYTLLCNEHVRIDVLSSRLSARGRAVVEIIGLLFMLLPFAIVTIDLAVPFFWQALRSGEMSSNAGGLVRWPVYLLIPVGFILLALQAVSELIKRCAFLTGHIPDPAMKPDQPSAEQELAESILAQRAGQP